MYLAGLCLTIVMFLGIYGDRLDSLETKIDALVTYIQTDLLLLRENVKDNREQISKLADLVNNSMTALTHQQYTPSQGITSTKVAPNTDTEHIPDLKLDILQLQSDMERIRRATYEEKRYGRQVYQQLKDAIANMQEIMQLNHNETQKQFITSDKIVETTMNTLRNEMQNAMTDTQTSIQLILENQFNQGTIINKSVDQIETTVNISLYELNEMQTKIKDTIIENQIKLTSETEEHLNRDNSRFDISLNELKTKIDDMQNEVGLKQNQTSDTLDISLNKLKTKMNELQNEVGVNQTHFYARLSQQHADLITTQSDIDVKFANVSQGLTRNYGLLEVSKAECAIIRNHIESAESSIEAQIKIVKLEVLKDVRQTLIYSHDRNTRLNNVTYLNDFRIGGRLEVYHNGKWGTVCNDHFGDTDATVACKEFGYANGKAYNPTSTADVYGQGQGEIWLDNLKCTGSESNIRDCSHPGWGVHDCTHQEDIGVTCF